MGHNTRYPNPIFEDTRTVFDTFVSAKKQGYSLARFEITENRPTGVTLMTRRHSRTNVDAMLQKAQRLLTQHEAAPVYFADLHARRRDQLIEVCAVLEEVLRNFPAPMKPPMSPAP